jgi:hypothetical protein
MLRGCSGDRVRTSIHALLAKDFSQITRKNDVLIEAREDSVCYLPGWQTSYG